MFSKSKSPLVRASADEAIPETTTRPLGTGSPLTNGRVVSQTVESPRRPPASVQDSAASERDERRHRRAIVRERSARDERHVREHDAKAGEARKRDDAEPGAARKRGAKAGERLHQAKAQLAEPSRRGRLALGETVSLGLIGIVVVGVAAGAILGAIGAAGWIVGLLVATLTLCLSAALRHAARRNRDALS
jgi:Flp pilus assembly protein TadB